MTKALSDEFLVSAPPGTLGVTLQQVSDEFEGSVVLVKNLCEDSPLLGKVELGDEMVSINGVLVAQLSDAAAQFQSTVGIERTIKMRRRL